MPNDWFQFNQFRIEQDMCAMKVGTDGVILGAWTGINQSNSVLDIGTGTGLLALMIAQRCHSAQIDAIEIDKNAAVQAKQNVANSMYHDRIEIMHSSFQNHIASEEMKKYDLVICNPPYFSTSVKGNSDQRNIARHDDLLPLETLISGVRRILSEKGRLSIIFPVQNEAKLSELLGENGLYINCLLKVYPTPEKEASRCCYEISAGKTQILNEKLVIEIGSRHEYSSAYQKLTAPFYL